MEILKIEKDYGCTHILSILSKKIADELNMTESNGKNVLYRTLKELNRLIQKESEGNES